MKKLFKHALHFLCSFLENKNEREFYRLFYKWGSYKRYTTVRNLKFLNYVFDVPDTASFIWQFKEIFSNEIYKFRTDNPQPTIFDCGANVGISCLYFKKLFPNAQIKAFEADPEIVNMLESNLLRNNIKDIDITKKAVWTHNRGIKFDSDGADGGSINFKGGGTAVESVRLKDLLMKEDNIDLLKMDIEGAEYRVLKDCSENLKNVQRLFVEYHSWNNENQKLSEILDIFERNNFRYYIEDIEKRRHPFINNGKEQNMDLQLNIFGVKGG